jgi:hypothetical protein
MAEMGTTWSDVDERVLGWVFELPPTFDQPSEIPEYPTWEPQPFPEIEGLDTRQVSDALYRLRSHGLVAGGDQDMGRVVLWWRLRVTARGLQVLGEWPDLDQLASAVSVRNVLLQLARDAPPEQQKPLKRAAGLLGRTSAEVVRDAVAQLSSEATREAME